MRRVPRRGAPEHMRNGCPRDNPGRRRNTARPAETAVSPPSARYRVGRYAGVQASPPAASRREQKAPQSSLVASSRQRVTARFFQRLLTAPCIRHRHRHRHVVAAIRQQLHRWYRCSRIAAIEFIAAQGSLRARRLETAPTATRVTRAPRNWRTYCRGRNATCAESVRRSGTRAEATPRRNLPARP